MYKSAARFANRMRIRASSAGCGGISSDIKGKGHNDAIRERRQLLSYYQRKGLELCPNCDGRIKKNIYLKHILQNCTCIKPKTPNDDSEALKRVYAIDPPSGYFRLGCIKILRSKEVFELAVKALKDQGVNQKLISRFKGIFEKYGLTSNYLNKELKISVVDKKIEFDWKILYGGPVEMAIIISTENVDDHPRCLYLRVPAGLQIRFPHEVTIEEKKRVMKAGKPVSLPVKRVLHPQNDSVCSVASENNKFPRKNIRTMFSDEFLGRKVISFKEPIMLSMISKETRMEPHELISIFKSLGYKVSMAHPIPGEQIKKLLSKIGINTSKIVIL
jgi:hypothetical protein